MGEILNQNIFNNRLYELTTAYLKTIEMPEVSCDIYCLKCIAHVVISICEVEGTQKDH
jgi:hypothetical protein